MAPASKGTKAGTLAWALGLSGGAVCCLGAIAGPKLLTFQARARTSEAKANLRMLFVAELDHERQAGAYSADLASVGFDPERGNRYAYFLAEAGPLVRRNQAAQLAPDGGYSVLGNDTFKLHGEELTSYAQTGCRITPGRDPDGAELRLGATASGFVAAAARQDSKGAPFDCWSISSMERTTASGQRIPSGEPLHESERE
jgi:type IV pilus assembly protein PilA